MIFVKKITKDVINFLVKIILCIFSTISPYLTKIGLLHLIFKWRFRDVLDIHVNEHVEQFDLLLFRFES